MVCEKGNKWPYICCLSGTACQYYCTESKRWGKKIDRNYIRMRRTVLNKSWKQHPTKHQMYIYLCVCECMCVRACVRAQISSNLCFNKSYWISLTNLFKYSLLISRYLNRLQLLFGSNLCRHYSNKYLRVPSTIITHFQDEVKILLFLSSEK